MNRRSSPPPVPTALVGLLTLGLLLSGVALANETSPRKWTKKSFAVQGTWTLVEDDGARYVVLSDDFKTRNAPDLKLFLSKHSAAEANNDNATDGSVRIAELRSNRGAQRYRIPNDVDLGAFSSLLLHCEQYSKLWAAAPLRSSEQR